MISVRFSIRRDKKRKDGRVPIYIRIYQGRRSSMKSTGIWVKPRHWNQEKQQIRKGDPMCQTLNERLELLQKKGEEALTSVTENGNASADRVKAQMESKEPGALIDWIDDYYNKLGDDYFWRAKRIKNLKNKLESFSTRELTFSDLTPALLTDFARWLEKSKGKKSKGNKRTTVARIMTALKMVVTSAVEHELIRPEHDPFLRFHYNPGQSSHKVKLSPEQIKAIINLELNPPDPLWHTKNYFLFSFYCAGIRFSDLARLRWSNITGEYLSYVMSKTKHKRDIQRNIKLVEPAKVILGYYKPEKVESDDRIFPLLEKTYPNDKSEKADISSKNASVNRLLKKIAEQAGIQRKISFHVSRHSYADFARQQGMDLYSISKSLGHSKLATTEVYLKELDQNYVDKNHEELFKNL